MKKLTTLITGAAIALSITPVAQANTLNDLYDKMEVQQCQNDWAELGRTLNQMMTHPDASIDYINQLVSYRDEVRGLLNVQAVVEFSNCDTILSEAGLLEESDELGSMVSEAQWDYAAATAARSDSNEYYGVGDIEATTSISSNNPSYRSNRSSSSPSSGRCQNPDDIASDGSRCGNRASSVRPGGRP